MLPGPLSGLPFPELPVRGAASPLVRSNALIRIDSGVWQLPGGGDAFDYSDGLDTEAYLRDVLIRSLDRSSVSEELESRIRDWPTEYHLSGLRSNLLRAFDLKGCNQVLELGCGCGAITRYLSEQCTIVDAVEGSAVRAELAWLRCRDIDNASIVRANFNDLEIPAGQYDAVFLIGVLEYALRFYPDAGSHRGAVERILSRLSAGLRPEGILVIAIENRLGLKYLLGACEDHRHIPYIGVHGYFDDDQVRTYSRAEWVSILGNTTGEAVRFLYPFPDYKLPTLVVSEKYLETEPSAGNVLWNMVSRDYGGRLTATPSEREIWAGLHQTAGVPDLANSFLIVTGRDIDSVNRFAGADFAHYSSSLRRPAYRTVTWKPAGRDIVKKAAIVARAELGDPSPIIQECTDDAFRRGIPLSYMWGRHLSTKGYDEEFSLLVRGYYEYLTQRFALSRHPGDLLDLIPANILVDSNQNWDPIDREWVGDETVSAEYVLFRALLCTVQENRDAMRGVFLSAGFGSVQEFIDDCFTRLGLRLSGRLKEFIRTEDRFQSLIRTNAAYVDTSYQLRQGATHLEYHPELKWSAKQAYPAWQSLTRPGTLDGDGARLVYHLPEGVRDICRISWSPRIAGIVGLRRFAVTARDASGRRDMLFELCGRSSLPAHLILDGVLPSDVGSDERLFVFEDATAKLLIELPPGCSGDWHGYEVSVEMRWHRTPYFGDLVRSYVRVGQSLQSDLALLRQDSSGLLQRNTDLQAETERLRDLLESSRHELRAIRGSRTWRWIENGRRSLRGLRGAVASPGKAVGSRPGTLHAPPVRFELPAEHYRITTPKRLEMRRRVQNLAATPLISVVMPVHDPEVRWLDAAVCSVRDQIYGNWNLCIVDDASDDPDVRRYLGSLSDPRIRVERLSQSGGISAATNKGIGMSAGDYVAFLDHDDELTADALLEVASAIDDSHPDLLYSDEDLIDPSGRFVRPYFKPDFAPDLLLSHNYITHFCVYRREFLISIGELRSEFDGAQDYDLILRATERTEKIHHVPKILYHWRQSERSTSLVADVKPEAARRGRDALTAALARRGIEAEVADANMPHFFRVKRRIHGTPLVSIIIPFSDRADLLETCLGGLLEVTTYPEFEVIGISNCSAKEETRRLMRDLERIDSRVRFHDLNVPFNFSKLVNHGVGLSGGEHVVLLNNDVRLITWSWIEAMLEHSQRTEIGAVGGKLYYPDDTVQHAGIVLGIGGYAGHGHKRANARARGYFNRLQIVHNVSAVTGAFMMVKKAAWRDVGGFDETHLRVACNDVDFCLRLLRKGLRNVFTPYAEGYHLESASRGYEMTAEKKARFEREKAVFTDRHKELLTRGDPYYNPNLTLDTEDFSVRQLLN